MSETTTRSVEQQRLLDEVSIRRLLHRLARSTDRADLGAIAAACDPAAIIHDGPLGYSGVAQHFGAWIDERRDAVDAMATHLTNVTIEVHDDRAAAESYAITIELDAGQRVHWRSGRYLDLLHRTGGGWRLAGREYVLDIDLPVPADPVAVTPIGTYVEGVRTTEDASFGLFAAIANGLPWPDDGADPA